MRLVSYLSYILFKLGKFRIVGRKLVIISKRLRSRVNLLSKSKVRNVRVFGLCRMELVFVFRFSVVVVEFIVRVEK